MDKIICIYTAYDSMKAEMIRASFEAAEIDCFIQSNNAGGVLPHLDPSQGFQIMIREEDSPLAKQILATM